MNKKQKICLVTVILLFIIGWIIWGNNALMINEITIDSRNTDIEIAISFSEKASAIAPTYYVSGNHEARIDEYEDLTEGLENAGVQVLKNESVLLEESGESICVAGMEDPSFVTDYLFGDSETVAITLTWCLVDMHMEDSFDCLLLEK